MRPFQPEDEFGGPMSGCERSMGSGSRSRWEEAYMRYVFYREEVGCSVGRIEVCDSEARESKRGG